MNKKEILGLCEFLKLHGYENTDNISKFIFGLQQENKQLKEELKGTIGIVEHNRRINEKNREIRQLKIQIFSEKKELCNRLESNWNKLKEYIKTEIPEDVFIDTGWFVSILDKMQELEGSDSNGQ